MIYFLFFLLALSNLFLAVVIYTQLQSLNDTFLDFEKIFKIYKKRGKK